MARALIITDCQNDFFPGGACPIDGADSIIPIINQIRSKFQLVILTQDWHSEKHVSFQLNNPGSTLFQEFKLENESKQFMWPVHCLQDSQGANFNKNLLQTEEDFIVQKAAEDEVEQYSAFGTEENPIELELKLQEYDIKQVYVCGLLWDFSAGLSAIDSSRKGYQTFFIMDACKGLKKEGVEEMNRKLCDYKVRFVNSGDV